METQKLKVRGMRATLAIELQIINPIGRAKRQNIIIIECIKLRLISDLEKINEYGIELKKRQKYGGRRLPSVMSGIGTYRGFV